MSRQSRPCPNEINIHHRHSIRWGKHNYSSPGAHYLTICIQDYLCLLGNVSAGVLNLNDAGRMGNSQWQEILTRFPTMQLDEYIVTPNHFHGILHVVGAPLNGQARGLPLRHQLCLTALLSLLAFSSCFFRVSH
jgi:hypothetical protein